MLLYSHPSFEEVVEGEPIPLFKKLMVLHQYTREEIVKDVEDKELA